MATTGGGTAILFSYYLRFTPGRHPHRRHDAARPPRQDPGFPRMSARQGKTPVPTKSAR